MDKILSDPKTMFFYNNKPKQIQWYLSDICKITKLLLYISINCYLIEPDRFIKVLTYVCNMLTIILTFHIHVTKQMTRHRIRPSKKLSAYYMNVESLEDQAQLLEESTASNCFKTEQSCTYIAKDQTHEWTIVILE